MGVRKAGEQQIRTLTENSTGTYSITIPISLVRELQWQSGQKLVVTKQGRKLTVADWQA